MRIDYFAKIAFAVKLIVCIGISNVASEIQLFDKLKDKKQSIETVISDVVRQINIK